MTSNGATRIRPTSRTLRFTLPPPRRPRRRASRPEKRRPAGSRQMAVPATMMKTPIQIQTTAGVTMARMPDAAVGADVHQREVEVVADARCGRPVSRSGSMRVS